MHKNFQRLIIATLAVCSLVVSSKATFATETTEVNEQVKLNITNEEGFVHPGISVDPNQLEITRKELIDGNSVYKKYYEAMKQTDAANKNFGSSNLKEGTLHEPNIPAYENSTQTMRLSRDSFKAYTQSILYYLTGDSTYRYNAMRLVRIWSQMDPEQFEYFPDAHIHAPVPAYYLISAAEMLKYTEAVEATYSDDEVNDYGLEWTKEDDENLVNHFIDPAQKAFYNRNDHYMNQHLYAITGIMATAIYKNDPEMYQTAVEWFTVNKDTQQPERNGALSHQYSLIKADQEGNPIGKDYIQHLEMGRDNAHSSGDVLNMIGLARILTQQETLVDPTTGEASKEGVSIYKFLDDRLLEGTEQWAKFMVGQTIPWTKTGGGMDFGGDISPAYRGRTSLYYSSTELYDRYRFGEGMSEKDLEEKAPTLSHMAKNQAAARFYSGSGLNNFWGSHSDNKMTEIGAEYWLSMPVDRTKDQALSVPETPDTSEVSFVARGSILDEDKTQIQTENGKTFFRTQAVASQKELKETAYKRLYPNDETTKPGGNHFSVASLFKNDNMAISYRSNGEAKLMLSGANDFSQPHSQILLPDTSGQWKTIVYSAKDVMNNRTANLSNLDFYAVLSDEKDVQVDFEWVNYVNEGDGIKGTVPIYGESFSKEHQLLKGDNVTFDVDIETPKEATISFGNQSEGLSIDGKTVTVDSNKLKDGLTRVFLIVEDDLFISARELVFNVHQDPQSAFDEAMKKYDSNLIYTNVSKEKFLKEKEAVEQLLKSEVSTEEFLKAYEQFLEALEGLELLNPRVEKDQSFNYAAYPSILPGNTNAPNLLDDDDGTHSGDLRGPYYFDFGQSYRMTANKFQMQTRRGFANRYQGFNIYISNDNKNWTKINENETTQTDEMETIRVKDEYKKLPFRYIMLRCDNPGVPTDPAYPGISSFGEFRIYGERSEVNDKISNITMKNSGLKNMILPGEKVSLEIEATEEISDVKVQMNDLKAEVSSEDNIHWVASIIYPKGQGFGSEIPIQLDYNDASGNPGETVYETSKKQEFYISDDTNLINDAFDRVTKTSNRSPKDTAAWFDQDVSTMSEFAKQADGQTFVEFDFSDGPIKVDRIEFLARQDQYANRAKYYQLQASQDGKTWEDIAPWGKDTQDWQAFIPDDKHKDTAYPYLRLYMWANHLGITELRILGEQTEMPVEVDKSELEEKIKEAQALTDDDYTEESWKHLEESLNQAESLFESSSVNQEEIDEAVVSLNKAIEALVKKEIPVENLSLSVKGIQTVKVGQTLALTPTITPPNATNQTIDWQFSKEDVVSIDEENIVTAEKTGICKITAKAGEKSAIVTVRVTK